MITFEYSGIPINAVSAEYVFDVKRYYLYLQIRAEIKLDPGEIITMNSSSKQDFVVMLCKYVDEVFSYELVTKEQYNSLRLVSEEFTGEATVSNLLKTIGMPNLQGRDSVKTWWSIPKVSLEGLIQTLNRYSVFPNGGAPFFYLNLAGNIQYFDYVVAYASDYETILYGTLTQDIQYVDWNFQRPSKIRFLGSSVFEDKSESWSDTGFGSGQVRFIDTTGRFSDLIKTAYKNSYNLAKYTSRTVLVEEVRSGPHYLGQCVSYREKLKGVVIKSVIKLPLSEQSTVSTVMIACPILLEQK